MKTSSLVVGLLAWGLVATQARATPQQCTNDIDCDCGQVCSYANTPTICVNADGGDPGWCSPGQAGTVNGGCMYACQTCNSAYCEPAWSPTSICIKGSSSSGAASCPGSSSGSSSGGVGSSGGGSSSGAAGSSSSSGGTQSSTSKGGSSSSGEGGSSGGGSASTSTSTSATNGGGGCSQVPGDFAGLALLLATGLLARRRS